MKRLSIIAAALVLGVSTAGCGRSAGPFQPGSLQPEASAVTVHVVNNNFNDMDVYVVSQGVATRMGMVVGHSSGTFVLDQSFFPADQLRLVATPIGGNGRAGSGPLMVSPGQTIDFTIQSLLHDSMATVR